MVLECRWSCGGQTNCYLGYCPSTAAELWTIKLALQTDSGEAMDLIFRGNGNRQESKVMCYVILFPTEEIEITTKSETL